MGSASIEIGLLDGDSAVSDAAGAVAVPGE
jgi:hypothetical protein